MSDDFTHIGRLAELQEIERQIAALNAQRRTLLNGDAGADLGDGLEKNDWPQPDMAVLRLHRREPPQLPLETFGTWRPYLIATANAASCPVDYAAAPLLASASGLIGNARWAQAAPGWEEPPHLWCGNVVDSGDGKSPGSDNLMRDVLPVIEQKMGIDFPDQLSDWRLACEQYKAKQESWKTEVREAEKAKKAAPRPPDITEPPEPQMPRLRQHDVTTEKVAELLGGSAPKG